MTNLDLKENISALTIAILRPDVTTAEKAFRALNLEKRLNKDSVKDAYEMRQKNYSYKEISQILGITQGSAKAYVCRHKKRLTDKELRS